MKGWKWRVPTRCGLRYHLHPPGTGLCLPGDRDGCLHPRHPRLVSEPHSGSGADAWTPCEMALASAYARDPSQRSGHPVCGQCVCRDLLQDHQIQISMAAVGKAGREWLCRALHANDQRRGGGPVGLSGLCGCSQRQIGRFIEDVYMTKRIHSSWGI